MCAREGDHVGPARIAPTRGRAQASRRRSASSPSRFEGPRNLRAFRRARRRRRARASPATTMMAGQPPDAPGAPFARVMNPLHRPSLPATPPRLDPDSSRARRAMLSRWISRTTGHQLDARSDEVRSRRDDARLSDPTTRRPSPSRRVARLLSLARPPALADARLSSPFSLPLFHLRSPPGFLRGSVGRRRPVQAAQHASPRRRAPRAPRGRPHPPQNLPR